MNKIKKNTRIFNQYIKQNYDMSNSNIKRKYKHSHMVANYMLLLSKKIFPKQKEQYFLCYMIGLLHDFARFIQWKTYGTYKDLASRDHADWAVELLFQKNLISMFDIPTSYYHTIQTAIQYHNKFNWPQEIQQNCYCQMICDADRLSNIMLQSKGETPLFSTQDGFTQQIVECFKKQQKVDYHYMHTKGDTLLAYMSSIYLLHYEISKQIVKKGKYMKKMFYAYQKYLNQEDRNKIWELICEQ